MEIRGGREINWEGKLTDVMNWKEHQKEGKLFEKVKKCDTRTLNGKDLIGRVSKKDI